MPLSIVSHFDCILLHVCSKVAPQNIMYDRRVVRGNTFAALVIPVSKSTQTKLPNHIATLSRTPLSVFVDMQPDPMSVEKQKKAAAARRNRLQKMKVSVVFVTALASV